MRLAVTRTSERLQRLRELAQPHGIKVVPFPLTKTQEFPFEWPATIPPNTVDWLVFTSGIAVDAFYRQLGPVESAELKAARIAVIGGRSSQYLVQRGIECDHIASYPAARVLFEELCHELLSSGDIVVHPRPEIVATEPEGLLKIRGIHYVPIVCYRTIASAIDTKVVKTLTPDDFILFTSPSAIRVYHEAFGQPAARPVAIGPTTAASMNQYGWLGFITMKEAHVESILEYLP